MPWVTFTRDFNFHARHNITVAYKAGMTQLVTQRCADEAKIHEAAKPARRPDRREANDRRR